MLRHYLFGMAAALTATTLWGFTFLGPAAIEPVGIYHLVVVRYAIFGAVSVVVLAANMSQLRRLGLANFLMAMHLGAIGYVGFYLLLSMSAVTGGGVLASTLTGLIPAIVCLVSNSLEKIIGWGRLLAPLAVTCGGLVLINSGGSPSTGREQFVTGAALGVLAALAWSYFVVVNGRVLRRARFEVKNSVWTASIGFGAFCGSLPLIPLASGGDGASPYLTADGFLYFLVWCAAIAVLGSWGATWFWTIAAKHLPTTVMGPIIAMEAVFGALFNLMWQGRPPTFHEVWGGTLVVAGVFVCGYLFNKARAAPRERVDAG